MFTFEINRRFFTAHFFKKFEFKTVKNSEKRTSWNKNTRKKWE